MIKTIDLETMRKIKEKPESVRCIFCLKDATQVKVLIKGKSGSYICSNCVKACQEVL